jgi:hypothetical protein
MSDRHQERRCETCRYWHGPYSEECRRHAPVHVPLAFIALALALSRKCSDGESEETIDACHWGEWPATRPGEWCGEWEAAE